jgi:predicted TIM-barrel fold metal-dependent hydrolase
VKFLSAYTRALDFQVVAPDVAATIYAKGASGAALDPVQMKALEDYLFYEICARAAAHKLVVHIHTGNGNGPYFNNGRADPILLEAALSSKALRNTRFVLLHGGWPFPLHAQAMMDKPNTYADFSAQTFYLTTHALAEVLRGWLAWHPERVLFGSDAYSDANTPLSDYEEKQVAMTEKSRRALAIALTAMIRDEEITYGRAVEIAHRVMRDNAIALYGLSKP